MAEQANLLKVVQHVRRSSSFLGTGTDASLYSGTGTSHPPLQQEIELTTLAG